MTTLTLLTGSSRGMGEAMARQCLQAGHQVLGMARHANAGLVALAAPQQLTQWEVDLSEAQGVAERLATWLGEQDAQRFNAVQLINNAGVIATLAPLSQVPLSETVHALRVGLEATLLLTSRFLAATADWPAQRKVLNISSGLGRRAMAGSASYCAAKAGMDHFSRAVALEEAVKPNGARIVSLAPGVIATDMQVQLRSADPVQFPDRMAFEQLLAQGQLASPDDAARKVLAYLARADFGSQPVGDVRDA
ncbi:MAG: SDR family NAD(P)-dependent oxidoreductase [Ideonella sp.]|nr:SDR family NAD(P)-dependent oxidoreductase [Ideonella sp.]